MKTVVFTSKGTVNGTEYKKGDILNVSLSIFDRLVNTEKCAKEKVNGKPKRSVESD